MQNLGRRNISDNLTFLSMPSATWKPKSRPFLVCEEGTSPTISLTFLSMPSATWKPEIRAILWQHLPFFLFLGRRILDKKLMDHAI